MEPIKKVQRHIKFINDFFVQEIIDKKYSLTKIADCTATLVTESGYSFQFWIANDWKHSRNYYHETNFMDLSLTPEQQQLLHARFRAIYEDEYNRPEEVQKRKEKYEALKQEFEPSKEL